MKTVAWMCIVGLSTIAGSATSQEREATAGEIDDLRRSEQATIEGLKAGDVDAEQRIVEMLTMGGDANWHVGVAAALAVDPEKRSPTLIAGMIEALRRDVEWSTSRYAADLGTASRGEAPSHLARELALTGDPAILPPLAWRAAGVVAAVIYEFGLQAVPHLLNVALSPRATGTEAMDAMLVLASIVSTHGPGSYANELQRAAMLHLDGPPEGYMSAGKHRSGGFPNALEPAIALAAVLRTPELLKRLEVIAEDTPESIVARTGYGIVIAKHGPACASAHLDGTEPPPTFCDSRFWVDAFDRFDPSWRKYSLKARSKRPGG